MDYSTSDLMAMMPEGTGLTERERRRLMKKQQAGMGLLDTEQRALDNDEARRRIVADETAGPALGLLSEMTGVPSIMRGAENIGRGYNEGDVMRGLGGAGEMVMGAMPGAAAFKSGRAAIGSMYATGPRALAAGGALTLPMAYTESAEAAKAKQMAEAAAAPAPAASASDAALFEMVKGNPTLEARYQLLMQKNADAQKKIEGVNRASSDAIRNKAADEASQIRSELLAAIDKVNAEKQAARTKEENKNKSVREVYAEYMPYLAAAPMVLGAAGGATIKGMYNKAYNTTTRDVSNSWKAAVDGGDKAAATTAQAEMKALQAKGPGGMLPATAFGAVEGGLLTLAPEELDFARAQPGSKLAEDTWNRLTDAPAMAKRVGLGVLGGAGSAFSAGELTGALMKRTPRTYGPETAGLTAKYTPAGTEDLNALMRYQSAEQQGKAGMALQDVKNQGLLAVAKEDAQGLLDASRRNRQLSADASPQATASADLMAKPTAQAGLVPAQSPLPPAPVSSGNLALPAPQKRGWADIWSDPARETVMEFATNNPGAPLSALRAKDVLAGIESRLPDGVRAPSDSNVRKYMKQLRDAVGDDATAAQLKKQFKTDPSRRVFGITGPAIAAGSLGLLSMDER